MLARKYQIGRMAAFDRRLDLVFGFHDIPRLIAESEFRIMFSPDRERKNCIAFVCVNGSIII